MPKFILYATYHYIEEYEVEATDEDDARAKHDLGESEHVRQAVPPNRVRLAVKKKK